ncbi:MAG: hypothetical protein WC483_06090 [Candidatus Paceibacterota bacterium]
MRGMKSLSWQDRVARVRGVATPRRVRTSRRRAPICSYSPGCTTPPAWAIAPPSG